MTQPRIYQCGLPYHITFNVLNREWIFEDEKKAELLHQIILSAGHLKNHTVYQFAIMPDHVHVLCKTEDADPHHEDFSPRRLENLLCEKHNIPRNVGFPTRGAGISDFIKSIKGTFAKQVNMGIVWQPRFHDEIIQTDEQLETVVDYIAYNPIKADLPEKWQKYPYQYKNNDATPSLHWQRGEE